MTTAYTVLRRFVLASGGLVINGALESAIDRISKTFKGAKLKKFQDSLQVLRDSIAQGFWVPRGLAKAQSGVYQGLIAKFPDGVRSDSGGDADDTAIRFSLKYGRPYHGAHTFPEDKVGVSAEVQLAWFQVCNELERLCDLLNRARPKPVLTEIGLSPKVTKTLKEMGVDIDLKTVKVPEIVEIGQRPVLDENGNLKRFAGKPVTEPIYKVNWTPGVKFGLSRFAGRDCEACGKSIPSNLYVPLEAAFTKGETSGRLALLVGRDCAKNIFGVRDEGIQKDQIKAP